MSQNNIHIADRSEDAFTPFQLFAGDAEIITQPELVAGSSAPTQTGTGNGTLTGISTGPNAVNENWTITCKTAATDGGVFSVVGSVSGAKADATVGSPYNNTFIAFTINDGTVDFVVGDKFVVAVATIIQQYSPLTRDSSSHKLRALTANTEKVTAVAPYAIDVSAGDRVFSVYKAGYFNIDALNWPSAFTTELQKQTALDGSSIRARKLPDTPTTP